MFQHLTKRDLISSGPENASELGAAHCLVCGLGSLGQYCVAALKAFGMKISAIDIIQPRSWEVKNLPDLLEDLVIGDCRQPNVLQQAGIQQCRAVLLVTNNERINIEAAFAVRLLNPHVRLVVRSAEQKLNQLLDQQLGNFTAFEVTNLPASALAIAALSNETQGLITLGDRLLRIVQCPIDPTHRWCDRRLMHELNIRTRRVLSHCPHATALPTQRSARQSDATSLKSGDPPTRVAPQVGGPLTGSPVAYGGRPSFSAGLTAHAAGSGGGSGCCFEQAQFHQWEPGARIRAGDVVTYIEVTEGLGNLVQPAATPSFTKTKRTMGKLWQSLRGPSGSNLRRLVAQQTKRIAILVGITVLLLLVLGTTILKVTHPQESWFKALYVSGVMLLGSYDIVLGALDPSDSTPLWIRFLNLSYMLAGTASIAILYALLTESLLAAKFELPNKRPPLPQKDHVVLIGLDRIGLQIATFLQKLKQPLVGVSNVALEPSVLPEMPLLVGDFRDALVDVNLATAKSVVVATDNEMANLEIGLMAHALNPDAALVIQTFEPDFSNNLDRLLPYAKVLCSYSLAAEAFAAAVFGDHILDLLQLNDQTLLVAEYNVQPEDSLRGLLLAEVAYGYGAVPILYQDRTQTTALLPSDDTKLEVGDRLMILATVDSLHQIDRGEKLPRCWQVHVNSTVTRSAVFEGVRTITRIAGCSLSTATEVMNHLPAVVPVPLYQHQALRLVRELSKIQTQAHLIPVSPASL